MSYVQADLDETLPAGTFIQVKLGFRSDGLSLDFPTRFNVLVSEDGSTWVSNCEWNVCYTGPGTITVTPAMKVFRACRYIRFVCTQGFLASNLFALSELQVSTDYATSVTDPIDPTQPQANYSHHLDGFSFEHTRSVLDACNRDGSYWNMWHMDGYDANGKWTRDRELLEQAGVEMPDYSYLDHAQDSRIASGVRQAAHVVEHDVYVLPGTRVLLQPYTDVSTSTQYDDKYIRWYNYGTDRREPNLVPLGQDWMVAANEHGTYSGVRATLDSRYDVLIYSSSDYKAFATRVNNGETTLSALVKSSFAVTAADAVPIGTKEHPFRGTFCGCDCDNSHRFIQSLTLDMPEGDAVGMFGYVAGGAVIKNVSLYFPSFKGKSNVAMVACVDENASADDKVLIENVTCTNSAIQADDCAAVILGRNLGHAAVEIVNCAVYGTVKGSHGAAAMAAWMGDNPQSLIQSSMSEAIIAQGQEGNQSFCRGTARIVNCYDQNGQLGEAGTSKFPATQERLDKRFWTNIPLVPGARLLSSHQYDSEGSDWLGYWGRGPMEEAIYYTPKDGTVQEVTIAADLSQTYQASADRNLDRENQVMREPAVMVRHLFNIKDGVKLAQEMSGSKESNEAYIRDHRRAVSARAGADFQVRLDIPLPGEDTFQSNLYYQDEDGNCKPIPSWEIRVYDQEGTELPSGMFAKLEKYQVKGLRKTGGQGEQDHYFAYHGDGNNAMGTFYRMVGCTAQNAKAGTYVVKLMATDAQRKPICIRGTQEPLELAEYVVTFEPSDRASLLSEEALAEKGHAHHRKEYLMARYGAPKATVNYDEYRLLEQNQPNSNDYILNTGRYGATFGYGPNSENAKIFMWPQTWGSSNYAFGYNQRHDYSMYVVTNHAYTIPYQGYAYTNSTIDNFGKGHGLHDRLFYDTKGERMGYFYCVNAASDPGVMAKAHIQNVCAGSTIHVSAWLSEFSGGENANIIINFQARLKRGGTVTLHSFVTGYVDNKDLGRWVHVYYSFVPRFSDFGITSGDVASYEVVLENNCKSSQGADYAIDDIEVFVAKPTAHAKQMELVCSDVIAPQTKVYAPFDETLESNGLAEAFKKDDGRTVNLYYCFLDKKKYDEAIASGKDGTAAYDEAVLQYEYMKGNGVSNCGVLSFSTFYGDNPQYVDERETSAQAYSEIIDGDRCLCFNTFPTDDAMTPGKEYYIALYTEEGTRRDAATRPGAADFDIESACSKVSVLRVQASDVIKVNGVVINDANVTVCANQQPTIQLDLWGMSTTGRNGMEEVEQNACFDWYAGSLEQFEREAMGLTSLRDILAIYRSTYPETASLDVKPQGKLTQAMLDYLKGMTATTDGAGAAVAPRLYLYRSAYTFPPIGEDAQYVYVVAVPIDKTYEDVLVCSTPSEIRLQVFRQAPGMTDGFDANSGVTYPSTMSDVPLRVGLAQLQAVSAPTAKAQSHARQLIIPVNRVLPVTAGVSELTTAADDNVYLAETNDPMCKDLTLDDSDRDDWGLPPVGVLQSITARKDGDDNQFALVFYSDQITFREGYFYTLKFGFDEAQASGTANPCSGELVFTLKVVPKYQRWTGAVNSNWNNDDNWVRVSSADLCRDGDASQDECVTDGSNANTASYVPMDFTRAIIDEGVTPPCLYAMSTKEVTPYAGNAYQWPFSPGQEQAGTAEPAPTANIQYDMLAVGDGTAHIKCRPWYANTCREIHFRAGSEMLGQQHLAYGKAWVELALATGRWYTLGSPLQSVVAGDFYLPSKGARQETELFQPITFTTGYDRFNPAVYQRAWNQATANLYRADGTQENAAVRTAWSHVYNDVNEDYSHGGGFSVKVDASRQEGEVSEALFRLPKDDASYGYFTDGAAAGATGNVTVINRGGTAYRLLDASGTLHVSSAGDSKYFLVANPFMSHLDMAKFLTANSAVVNPKYWVLTSDTQNAAILLPESGTFVANTADAGTLPPMQAFFVEARESAHALSLSYDESMMTVDGHPGEKGGRLLSPARHRAAESSAPYATGAGVLRISALRDGSVQSQALVSVRAGTRAGYDEAEDVALIDDAMQQDLTRVYTVADGVALDVNTLPSVDSVEVGLMGQGQGAVTLRFNGVSEQDGLWLVDQQAGKSMPLTEGMAYTVYGNTAGRLYIRHATQAQALQGIRISTEGKVLSVIDHAGTPISVDVYAPDGALVGSYAGEHGVVRERLTQGVYVVEARGEWACESRKVAIP